MEEVFPVGNTHLPYYEDVMEYFEERGFSGEDSRVLIVGGELIAWHLKHRYPDAEVESIDVNEGTMEIQSNIGAMLSSGREPEILKERVADGDFLEFGEQPGTIYPEIIEEIGNRASRPDESRVEDFEEYTGDPDVIISNNVCDYFPEFMGVVNSVDPDYLEMYTIFPAGEQIDRYEGDMEPEVNPEVDFWWVPYGGQEDVVLYSTPN